MIRYEIAITGSSRPSLYPIFWESMNDKLKMQEKPKITVYEDVILPKESAKVREYIKPKVDEYHEFKPNMRLGKVFDQLLKRLHKQYFIYLQEDWEFLKEIDIDALVNVMDNNPDIGQIWFPKPLEGKTYRDYCGDPVELNGVHLIPYDSWAFLPHIARTAFVRDAWNDNMKKEARPESPFKKSLKNQGIIPEKRVSYILGKRYETHLEHLGWPDLSSRKLIEKRT